MRKMGFSWFAGRTVFVLLTLLMACTLPSSVRASTLKKVLKAMLRKELKEEVRSKAEVNGVEYLKIDAVAGSPLEKIVESNAVLTARLYEQDLLSLVHYAMVADWDLWLETMKQNTENIHYYQHPFGSQNERDKSILLIAISRQLKDALPHKLGQVSTWNENLHEELVKKKKEEGDECMRRMFSEGSEEGVLHKEKLWKSHFVRIKIMDVCILSFAVVAQANIHNHVFVNKKLFSYVWPKIKIKDGAYEIPISHDRRSLMKMMLKGPDDVEVRKDEHSDVLYQKILLASSQLRPRYKPYIPELLDEAITTSWKHNLNRKAESKLSTPEGLLVGTFLYYEWKTPPHSYPIDMRMLIAIARENTKKDDCLDLFSDELLQRINVYEAYYVHLKGKNCIISYMIVACQDYSMIGPLSHRKPFENLPLTVINKLCPTNKLIGVIKLPHSS